MHVAVLVLDLLVVFANEVGQHFGVGGRVKFMPGLEHDLLERLVILNDPVVDDGDAPGLVEVRMGIFIGRRPVGGPAGVAHAKVAGDFLPGHHLAQAFVNLPLALDDLQVALAQHGHPRAVIAAVFQPPQCLQEDGAGLALANISDDAAHGSVLLNPQNHPTGKPNCWAGRVWTGLKTCPPLNLPPLSSLNRGILLA